MRIGELAGLVGISTRAIRHYHRVGLLAEPARKANGYREYSLLMWSSWPASGASPSWA
jgi:DNA-binding transcriptional MerR regulator